MAWWNRLFKKKEPIQQEEDWEQLVYTRNGVNFDGRVYAGDFLSDGYG